MNPQGRHPGRRGTRGAFTLVELLVVISIFVLVLAIGVPAFSSLLYSSDQSLAENALKAGLSSARDAAARSADGQDAAAVFFYDDHRPSIVTCIRTGTALDFLNNDPTQSQQREFFAPVPGLAPVQLPRGWMIRGLTFPDALDGQTWYEDTYPSGSGGQRPPNWVFPETSFFEHVDGLDGEDRQTFMIRFEGGSGRLKVSDTSASLVFAPSPSLAFRTSAPWSQMRADREADGGRFGRRVAAAPPAVLQPSDKVDLLGDRASDTVLTKAVGQVALYNESRLAGALGARPSDVTGCLYAPGNDPVYVAIPGITNPLVRNRQINQWIENRLTGLGGAPIPSDARVFAVHSYLGWLTEVTGTHGQVQP
ncbi:MAG: Tfp pilus assembly protein FimT/FimU [Phycisphaerales bacterium]